MAAQGPERRSKLNPGSEAELRARLVAAGARLGRSGLLRGFEGNLSCRLDAEHILLTPRGAHKDALEGWELSLCRLDSPLPPSASSEGETHRACYLSGAEVGALVHAHPRHLLAADMLQLELNPHRLTEVFHLLPRIARVDRLAPGGLDLARACAEAVQQAFAVVLSGHGALTLGVDIEEAVARMEALDTLAAVSLISGAGRTC
jgi:L-fuculose-phosphate aldolase